MSITDFAGVTIIVGLYAAGLSVGLVAAAWFYRRHRR